MPNPPIGRRPSSPSNRAQPLTPIPFGPYELIRRIGAGGMGEVYLARETAAEGPRALVVKKVLPHLSQNLQFVGRFLDEARVVVRLNHPNIARVYAMGEVDHQYYLAMEYVQGKTLSRLSFRLRERGMVMPLGIALLIGERLCRGLHYAHDATTEDGKPLHLVHRDLSPANVCVSYRGEVKVIDFGAAQSTVKLQETAPRVVIGNLSYMAPEQARKRFVDRRADVYSVGVLLWELLTQNFLPQKGDPVERWRRAAYPIWEPPSRLRADLPAEVDAVLLQALSSDPDARPQSAAALADRFRELRKRFAPQVNAAELGALLSRAFPAERAAEFALVRSVLEPSPQSAPESSLPNLEETLIIPPTALAFEHSAVDAPADYVPEAPLEEEVTAPGVPLVEREPGRAGRSSPTLNEVAVSDVGFGVSFGEKTRGGAEATLVREIQGQTESLEDSLLRELDDRSPPPPARSLPVAEASPRRRKPPPRLPTPLPSPDPRWADRARDPKDQMQEPLTSDFDTPRSLRFQRLAAVVFISALLLGFAVVWLLLRR